MQVIVNPVGRLVPQQVEPVSTTPVDGDGGQCLADEVKQSAYGVDRQQDAENLQNRQRLLVEVCRLNSRVQSSFSETA